MNTGTCEFEWDPQGTGKEGGWETFLEGRERKRHTVKKIKDKESEVGEEPKEHHRRQETGNLQCQRPQRERAEGLGERHAGGG